MCLQFDSYVSAFVDPMCSYVHAHTVIIILYMQHALRQNCPTLNTCMSCDTCSFIYMSTGLQYTAIPSRLSTTEPEMDRVPSSSTMNSSPPDVLLTPDSSCAYTRPNLLAQDDNNLEIQCNQTRGLDFSCHQACATRSHPRYKRTSVRGLQACRHTLHGELQSKVLICSANETWDPQVNPNPEINHSP